MLKIIAVLTVISLIVYVLVSRMMKKTDATVVDSVDRRWVHLDAAKETVSRDLGPAFINDSRKDHSPVKVEFAPDRVDAPTYAPYAEPAIPQSFVSGVSFDKDKGLWRVRFRVDGVRTHFGYFDSQKQAEALCLSLRSNKYEMPA